MSDRQLGDAVAAAGLPKRFLLGAFGDPGHAFPMLALGQALVARGHDVTLQTWSKWREHVERDGMTFWAAPEYRTFPSREDPTSPHDAAGRAAAEMVGQLAELAPDAVVADVLTLAPALAAEACGIPWATLVPHLNHMKPPEQPPFSSGFLPARSAAGRALWRRASKTVEVGLRRGRDDLNEARARVGLGPTDRLYGGVSADLTLVATFPQFESPSQSDPTVKIIGPVMWEPPFDQLTLPPGDEPLVLIAPSTSQDPTHELLQAAVKGLGGLPIRVLAATNRRPPYYPLRPPANTTVVDWVSYSKTMPFCSAVVCHGGHGTVMRALSAGAALVVCPAAGDMFENAARIETAGVGKRIPTALMGPRALRLAVEQVLSDGSIHKRAAELRDWAAQNDGARNAANELERFTAAPLIKSSA